MLLSQPSTSAGEALAAAVAGFSVQVWMRAFTPCILEDWSSFWMKEGVTGMFPSLRSQPSQSTWLSTCSLSLSAL